MPRHAKRSTPDAPAPKQIVPSLLAWFAVHARDLPWRRTCDPYAIWVSEIMLQQTQVQTVIPYWERWMHALPTVESLAGAPPGKIHKLWEGLGYYTRVRNMQKAAQQICAGHGGVFPARFEDILALPGIGPYTAGAVASIAFDQPAPILDGNVIRVLTRLHGIATDPREKKTSTRLWQLASDLVHAAARNTHHASRNTPSCSALNQSLMELGALVCTPRLPQCSACPVAVHCTALRENRVGQIPQPRPRAAATARRIVAFVVGRGGRLLVRQRSDGMVNAHLWEFPNIEAMAKESVAAVAEKFFKQKPRSVDRLCVVKHTITRYRMTTEAHCVSFDEPSAGFPGVWRTPAQLHKLPFTAAHRRIAMRLPECGPSPARSAPPVRQH